MSIGETLVMDVGVWSAIVVMLSCRDGLEQSHFLSNRIPYMNRLGESSVG